MTTQKKVTPPSAEYQRLITTVQRLEQRGLYRRAAAMWRNAVVAPGLTEKEREQCASHAAQCSTQGKYVPPAGGDQ